MLVLLPDERFQNICSAVLVGKIDKFKDSFSVVQLASLLACRFIPTEIEGIRKHNMVEKGGKYCH